MKRTSLLYSEEHVSQWIENIFIWRRGISCTIFLMMLHKHGFVSIIHVSLVLVPPPPSLPCLLHSIGSPRFLRSYVPCPSLCCCAEYLDAPPVHHVPRVSAGFGHGGFEKRRERGAALLHQVLRDVLQAAARRRTGLSRYPTDSLEKRCLCSSSGDPSYSVHSPLSSSFVCVWGVGGGLCICW